MNIEKDSKGFPVGFSNENALQWTKVANHSTHGILDPFGNCQTFVMGSVNGLFQKYQTNKRNLSSDPWEYNYKEIALFFIKMQMCNGSKRQVLIDIHDHKEYHQIIDEIFKDNIVFKTPYVSTNNSKMCICLLKLQGCTNYITELERLEELEKQRKAEEEKARLIAEGKWVEPKIESLPDKWFIRWKTKERFYVLTKWENSLNTYGHRWDFDGYENAGFKSTGIYYNPFSATGVPDGYTEITFEQFEKYVLKKDSKEFPKEWAIFLNTSNRYTNQYADTVKILNTLKLGSFSGSGGWYYMDLNRGRISCTNDKPTNSTEVTYEQFKKHFVKEEVVDNSTLPF